MELTILLFLILLAILLTQSHPMFSNIFLLLAGIFSYTGITTNQITNITGGIITYTSFDPWITYVISFTLIAMAVINFIDLIDERRKIKDAQF